MNIFKFELKTYLKSIIIWTVAVPGFLVLYMAFFPAIASSSEAFNELMLSFPKEFLAVLGMNPELPVTSALGYFGLTYSFVIIPVAIQASNYGFHMLSVEERELTADFLLTKPVKRSKILFSKFFAVLIALAIVNIGIWGATIFSLEVFSAVDVDMTNVYLLLSTLGIFQLFFVSIGMLISVLLKKISSVLSFSMALGIGMYVIQALNAMLGIRIFAYITPYAHFDYAKILIEGELDISLALTSVIVIIVSFAATYYLYNKRNISSL